VGEPFDANHRPEQLGSNSGRPLKRHRYTNGSKPSENQAMLQSPYVLHKDILLCDSYSTARRLQDFILHQYESERYPFDANQCLGGFDSRHLQIYSDLKEWFWNHGPDPVFKEIAEIIRVRRLKEALENLEELDHLRAMKPETYPAEIGESPVDAHKSAVESCEWFHRRYVAQGTLED
jgi:hypothetical protein